MSRPLSRSRAVAAVVGAAADGWAPEAREALLARFQSEKARGNAADVALLQELGRHLDVATLGASIAADRR